MFDKPLLLNDVKSPWALWSTLIRCSNTSPLEQDRFQPLGFGGRDFAGLFHRMNVRQIEWLRRGAVSAPLVPATQRHHQDLHDQCHKQSDDERDAAGDGHLLNVSTVIHSYIVIS